MDSNEIKNIIADVKDLEKTYFREIENIADKLEEVRFIRELEYLRTLHSFSFEAAKNCNIDKLLLHFSGIGKFQEKIKEMVKKLKEKGTDINENEILRLMKEMNSDFREKIAEILEKNCSCKFKRTIL